MNSSVSMTAGYKNWNKYHRNSVTNHQIQHLGPKHQVFIDNTVFSVHGIKVCSAPAGCARYCIDQVQGFVTRRGRRVTAVRHHRPRLTENNPSVFCCTLKQVHSEI